MINDKDKPTEQREMMVAKSNDLIQQCRYSLPLQQQKILLYLISKIKPTDNGNEEYTISIQDFCKVTGIDPENGFYYQDIKRNIKQLRDSSIWIKKPNGEEDLFAWLNTVKIHRGSGTIRITFHDSIQPYLFMLQERYTMYRIEEVLPFKSKYSIRLYELLQSYSWRGRERDEDGYHHSRRALIEDVKITFEIEQLRTLIDATNYNRTVDLVRRAIEPSVQEINSYSDDMAVSYEMVREGRVITAIEFTLSMPRAKDMLAAKTNRRTKLNREGSGNYGSIRQ